MELLIDNRETFLKASFPVPHAVHKPLDIGDVAISHNGTIVAVLERKTLKDYVASIKDGRLHEQKARLLEWKAQAPHNKVLYIIENWSEFPLTTANYMMQGVSVQAFLTSIINAMFRDNVHVIFTNDENDTARCVEHIYMRYQKNAELYLQAVTTDYIESVKLKKNKNITEDNVFVLQLSQIPGVSAKIAQAIYGYHNNMAGFIKHIDALPMDQRVGYLANLQFTTSTNKQRRVGDKTAATILQFCGIMV